MTAGGPPSHTPGALDDYVREVVARGWSEGRGGGGLLCHSPTRLLTWSRLAFGGPHHADVLTAYRINPDDVKAYLDINPVGRFTIASGRDAQAVVACVQALDKRLSWSDDGWVF